MAENALKMGRPEEALAHLEQAMRLHPDNVTALPAYGYALGRVGRVHEALDVLERYLAHFPEDARLQEEAGYLAVRAVRNREAAEHFRRAAALRRRERTYRPDEGAPQEGDVRISALGEAVWDLEKRFSLSGYLIRTDVAGEGEPRVFQGLMPSQVGFEAGWRPPVIGFRNYRIFELTARVLGSFENESWSYDPESTQLGLGVRLKPLDSENLWLSFERLVKIGDESQDNWLLRGLASRDWGREPPERYRAGHSGRAYADAGAFLRDSGPSDRRAVFHIEAVEGIRFGLSPDWAVVPHGVVDGHWESSGGAPGRYLEAGAGVEVLGWLGKTADGARKGRASLFAEYKWGAFASKPPGRDSRGFHGPVVGLSMGR
jgi:tetratricopeptide (TPR) repeat protein